MEPQSFAGSFLMNLSSCNPPTWSCDNFIEDFLRGPWPPLHWWEGRGECNGRARTENSDRRRGPRGSSCGEGGWRERRTVGAAAGAHGESIDGGEGIFSPTELGTKRKEILRLNFIESDSVGATDRNCWAGAPAPISRLCYIREIEIRAKFYLNFFFLLFYTISHLIEI